MLTPAEFELAWGDDLIPLVAFPEDHLRDAAVSEENRRFLAEAGLPEDAAPFLSFGPPPEDARTLPEMWGLPAEYAKYTVIGGNGSGDPIVVMPDGAVACLNHDDGMAEMYINRNVPVLAETLLRFRNLIAEAQRIGGPGAYWDAAVPAGLQREFRDFLFAADPRACEPDTLWGAEMRGWESRQAGG
ncbi:SUKH-4 family immunity protein [Longimicrobium terrae]|uniref:SMI1/KNR4 family protein n=1 Tax=Longimicrobium terrae TaxID=1639882 RepID=A0A841GZ82_9BACT|nr:SUKH-4 family immunity protein [Longimicrobium terrae]MBB4636886.1 hypothetical protein [Longimicrobium terrae]MBB6071115.1 hypothetical protein [Longimicrobium terrae]NNC29164.1 hypothetical protein [Longimicrobium terrae]